ncbi:uncharacterized protein LOC131579580 [Poecile atricapillus]|uniref:uncharacterized protein LOC131579580 n=1 Tax=Poecile atricapillus TaxID=48891 RepID=UPI00273947D0|nr:uncharacterized protein LOC131579580 [Poecile atricapillus]
MAEERGAELGAAPERRREPVWGEPRRREGAPGEAACAAGEAEGGGCTRRHRGRSWRRGGVGGGTGLACTERARLHGGGGRQQVRGWLRSPGRREGERGASRRCEGIRGAGERRRRSAPVPRVASEGHPRAQSLVVHRSLRQVRAGRGEELSSPASLRGAREINEADLYTIQFIVWKEGGGRNATCTPPPTPPPQDNPWVQVSEQVGSAPLGCPPSAPAASQRAIKVDPEHSWGGSRGRRAGGARLAAPLLRVFFPPPSRLLLERCFYFQSSAEGPESGADAVAAPGDPRRGQGTARCAARSEEAARSRRSQEKLHGSTRS